ncbi:hypothetical protein Zmor_008809 [Zophobas morio]|uniref:Translation initiation factor eIF-2B subunit alpha n=1 Tax=Zophobas morio TaxID=2755281 RepID=A0AA38HJF4_9CUCU|nr:hypothetical protein Zmor_008809 [Zophobas morio]
MIFLQDVNDWKNEIIERGKTFVENVKSSRQKAVQVGERFITDGATILTHGYSRTVKTLLLKAAQKKKFKVIVTEGRPECLGYRYAEELSLHEIPVTIILDSAVGRIMERVDFVIVGAENVTENGGVINKLGTYPLALTAVAAHKPVYGIVESFKFARLYPLRQDDLPPSQDETVNFSSVPPNKNTATKDLVKFFNPLFDFTPPSYIQLLFTDLGVLTPSAVSDELIKLCPN